MTAHRQNLSSIIAAALLGTTAIALPLPGAEDLATGADQALRPAAHAGAVFDGAPWFRLQALVRQAGAAGQLRDLERRLAAALESDAPLSVKQDVCRVLWSIGTAQSAPALKQLLGRPDTVDMACYAIAENPDPELGRAVREALPGGTGKVAISLLNLLGQRRDTAAVELAIPFLRCEQREVAAAAAAALGKIGGRPAVAALAAFRQAAPPDWRPWAEAAWLRAVESLEPGAAVPIWQELTAARGQSATVRRAAFLRLGETAPEAAWPWLLAALRDQEPALKPALGQVLRGLRGSPLPGQLVGGLREFPPASQVIAVEALGPGLPLATLVDLARQPAVRSAALRMLGSREEPAAAAALLAEALSPGKTDDRREIFQWLTGMTGHAATEVILEALPTAPAAWLPDLVKILVARGAKPPLEPILERARRGENEERIQAVRALRFAATPGDHAALFELLLTAEDPGLHEAVEETLAGVLGRALDAGLPAGWLKERLTAARRPQDRAAWLRLLAANGTASALQSVIGQARQGAPGDRAAAIRALAQWPNEAALTPLLELAREPLDEAQRALVLRASVRLLLESQLPAAGKVDALQILRPLADDPASGKLWLSAAALIHDLKALEFILPGLNRPAVQAEAVLAAVEVAAHLGPGHDGEVNAALNQVLSATRDPVLATRARALIRPAAPPLPEVWLDTLQPLQASSGNEGGQGRPRLNLNCIGQPLRLQGITYQRGVGEHAPAELTYSLQPAWRRFVAVVGLDDQVARFQDQRGSLVVKVFADTSLLVQTPLLRGGGASAKIDTALPAGAKTLRLVVEDAGDGVDFDDADFVQAGFLAAAPAGGPARP